MISHKKFFQLSGEDETQLAYLAQGGMGNLRDSKYCA